MVFRTFILIALALALALPAAAALDYPRPTGPGGQPSPVGDYAKVIPPQYVQRITAAATELEQKTGAAVVVATVPSLEGESIEQAAVQLYQKWGIGQKGQDKGVLFLIAPKERKLRIEVGYGLEGVITDATAGAIRDQALLPYLKKGQFGPALLAGVAAAATIIAQEAGVSFSFDLEKRLKEIDQQVKLSRNKYDQFVKKNDIERWPTYELLSSNPFALKGKIVGLYCVFKEMLSEDQALFFSHGPFIVEDVPGSKFIKPVEVILAAEVVGKKQLTSPIMGASRVPVLEYRGSYKCLQSRCRELFLWQHAGRMKAAARKKYNALMKEKMKKRAAEREAKERARIRALLSQSKAIGIKAGRLIKSDPDRAISLFEQIINLTKNEKTKATKKYLSTSYNNIAWTQATRDKKTDCKQMVNYAESSI